MRLTKRLFDLVCAASLLVLLLPAMALIALAIFLIDGRPIFYPSERMRSPARGFKLLKFRTMHPDKNRKGVTGGDKSDAITATGRFLRRTHLDELPQLWNVLRGDLSLVGPRPPLRTYVEAEPSLYVDVLRARPGITGLATLRYGRHEAAILAKCRTPDETHTAYLRRCVPRKAALDVIYANNQTICWDIILLLNTFWAIVRRP